MAVEEFKKHDRDAARGEINYVSAAQPAFVAAVLLLLLYMIELAIAALMQHHLNLLLF